MFVDLIEDRVKRAERLALMKTKQDMLLKGLLEDCAAKAQRKVLEVRDGSKLRSDTVDISEADIRYSRLHVKDVNSWLVKRYTQQGNLKYLHYPSGFRKRRQLMNIFENFDSDGNEQLEISEFVQMFITAYLSPSFGGEESNKRFYIDREIPESRKLTNKDAEYFEKVLQEKFIRLYKYATRKDYLSKLEFVKLAMHEEASSYFSQIMRELEEELRSKGKEPEIKIPTSFEKMTIHLGYCSQRDKLYQKYLELRDVDFNRAAENIEKILFLKSDQNKMEDDEEMLLIEFKEKMWLNKFKNFHLNAVARFIWNLGSDIRETHRKKKEEDDDDENEDSQFRDWKKEEKQKQGLKEGAQFSIWSSHVNKDATWLADKKNWKKSIVCHFTNHEVVNSIMKRKVDAPLKKHLQKGISKGKSMAAESISKVMESNKKAVLELVQQDMKGTQSVASLNHTRSQVSPFFRIASKKQSLDLGSTAKKHYLLNGAGKLEKDGQKSNYWTSPNNSIAAKTSHHSDMKNSKMFHRRSISNLGVNNKLSFLLSY